MGKGKKENRKLRRKSARYQIRSPYTVLVSSEGSERCGKVCSMHPRISYIGRSCLLQVEEARGIHASLAWITRAGLEAKPPLETS